jgi:transposase-like protein
MRSRFMQRIYPCELTPEEYIETEAHRQVRPGMVCPRCGKAGPLHRHGVYKRGITGSVGQVLCILIARFLCLACRGTVSYLPSFALSYRLVRAATFEAFLEGKFALRDVQSWQTLLQQYQRRMADYAPDIFRIVGCRLGRAPPERSGVWPWLKEACGSLDSATRRLVTVFQITPFQRYQCHQRMRP